jgi:hypothetical protein
LKNTNYIQNTNSVERLIALWALSEGFLGGILHLAKIPFTGLILGNVAVILITLIAKFSDKRGMILKATLIVLIVKGILSPHTPLTAYLAVSLQGIFGELLFYKRKFPFVSALLLGILVSLFSSVQKVFFLTVIFGKNLWDSIDQFTLIIFKEFFGLINSGITISVWLIAIYASIHLIAGILTGLYAARLARRTDGILKNESNKILFNVNSFIEVENSKTKKSKHKRWWFKPSGIFFFILTISLFTYSYLYPDYPHIKKDSLLIMLLRGILLMFIWYKFLSPLLMIGFKKMMNKKRNKYTKEIENVVNVLPLFKSIINFCWKETSSEKGLKRLHRFFTLSLLNLLTVELTKE